MNPTVETPTSVGATIASADDVDVFPPPWAGGWGQEDERHFVHLAIAGTLIELVWIDGGEFWMGSPESEAGRYQDEVRHRVTLTRGFWIGRFPVRPRRWQHRGRESGVVSKHLTFMQAVG